MQVVFMGSAALSCPSLEALARSPEDEVAAVVTQPDRPSGRGLRASPSPVRVLAEREGLPVQTPARVNAPEAVAALAACRPEVIVVVAYGQILRRPILALPPRGCINIHASLLPKYRGAAPIQWAVVNGETETGVTSMYMNERMDAGDMIFRQVLSIGPDETAAELHDRLAAAGAALLVRTLDAVRRDGAPRVPQREQDATPAPRLKKSDGRMDWTLPAAELYNRVRGFHPWPGAFCEWPAAAGSLRLKVLAARAEEGPPEARPGEVLSLSGAGPLVAAGRGALRLLRVQPEGKGAMSGDAFVRGRGPAAGGIVV